MYLAMDMPLAQVSFLIPANNQNRHPKPYMLGELHNIKSAYK